MNLVLPGIAIAVVEVGKQLCGWSVVNGENSVDLLAAEKSFPFPLLFSVSSAGCMLMLVTANGVAACFLLELRL